jgi:hypothetical protein
MVSNFEQIHVLPTVNNNPRFFRTPITKKQSPDRSGVAKQIKIKSQRCSGPLGIATESLTPYAAGNRTKTELEQNSTGL